MFPFDSIDHHNISQMIICQNCGYDADKKYCANCGQILEIKRINLPHLLHEVAHTFMHLEKGFLYTLKELARHPGTMQKKYLSGERLRFQKPFPLFAISTTFAALALYLIYKNSASSVEDDFYHHYYFLVQSIMLPVYAFVTYIFFFSPNLFYAEALVLNVYMVGFMSVFIIPINLLSFILPNGTISLCEIAFLLSYNVWTYLNFFKGKAIWWVVFKSVASIVGSYLLFNVASRQVMHWFIH